MMITRMKRNRAWRISRLLPGAGLRAMAAMVLYTGLMSPGGAEDCTPQTRLMNLFNDGGSAHTSVHNDTKDKTFRVEIFSNSETASISGVIKPGKKISHLLKINVTSTSSDRAFLHKIEINDSESQSAETECAYAIKYIATQQASKLRWTYATGSTKVCIDPDEICDGCIVTCINSYHKDKARWNTSFRISD